MGNYLVTGAGGGMGKAICARLIDEGHRVWGLDLNEAEGVIKTDITDAQSVLAACERVKTEAGSLDGIIHAAGVYDLNSLVEMPEDDEKSRQNMIVAAGFMARMIRKYGDKVLAKIEAKEKQEGKQYDGR